MDITTIEIYWDVELLANIDSDGFETVWERYSFEVKDNKDNKYIILEFKAAINGYILGGILNNFIL